jgi:hypothetical protein
MPPSRKSTRDKGPARARTASPTTGRRAGRSLPEIMPADLGSSTSRPGAPPTSKKSTTSKRGRSNQVGVDNGLLTPAQVNNLIPAKRAKKNKPEKVPQASALAGESTSAMSMQIDSIAEAVTKRVWDKICNQRLDEGNVSSSFSVQPKLPTASEVAIASLTTELTGGLSLSPIAEATGRGNPSVAAAWAGQQGHAPSAPTASSTSSLPNGEVKGQHGSNGVTLGAAVTPAIRGKILANEYICLASLLDNNRSGDEFALSVNQNSLQVKQVQRNKGIFNLSQWSQAFTVYMSVYLEKFPTQAQQLLSYMHMIQNMAMTFSGYGWRSYDEEFRSKRAASAWPWERLDSELYMRCVAGSFVPVYTSAQQGKSQSQSRGWGSQRYDNNRAFRQPFRGQNSFPRYKSYDRHTFVHEHKMPARSDHTDQRQQTATNAARL